MVKQKKIALCVQLASLGVVSTLFASISVFAQNDVAMEEPAVEETFITGSRIRRLDNESVSPVISISAQDIEASGFTSIQDVLADSPQNSGGSLDQQQVFGFTPAASGVNLRGAGLGRSLTLIDGKRLPKYPIPAGGTVNFVDTANIPLGAVERIEILTSGASAIYGSDAMGGVINIILKDEFEGFEIKGKYGDSSGGGRELNNVSMVAGAKSDNARLLFLLEHDKNESLKAHQRNRFGELGTDLAFDTPFGAYSSYGVSLRDDNTEGVVATLSEQECIQRGLQPTVTGGVDNCGFNRAARRDLYPEMERTSALVKFSMDIAEGMELYSRFDFTTSETFREIEPMPVADYTYYVGTDENGTADPGNVTLESDLSGSVITYAQDVAFGGDFASLADGIYFPTRRMIEFGNRQTRSETENYTLMWGLQGELGEDWNWDLNWQFSRTEFYDDNPGYASADLYFAFLASGENGRSVFDLMTPDEVASAAYIPWTDAQSTYTGFSGFIDGDLFATPAGDISWAFGFESYKEWFFNVSDTESQKGNILSTGGSSGEGLRDYTAVFGETLIPLLDNLSTTLAVRYDDFSDFGDNTSPQIGLEYRPFDNILVRALWADTFRAPDMQRVYGDPTQANSQIIDPFGCQQQGGTVNPASIIAACKGELYVDIALGPNADLGPEQGNNWDVGIVAEFGNLNASIDYWSMEINDLVNTLSAQDIATDYEIYGNLITRRPNGEIESLNATAQNLSFRTSAGLDLNLGYNLPFDELGQLRFKLLATYLTEFDEQFSLTTDVEDQMEVDRVPEWRAQFSLGWDIANFSNNFYLNYIGGMNGINNEDLVDSDLNIPLTIDSSYKINLSTAWQSENYTLQLGVNNVTDEGPTLDPTDYGWPYYPQEYFNALGRNYYVSASYKFD